MPHRLVLIALLLWSLIGLAPDALAFDVIEPSATGVVEVPRGVRSHVRIPHADEVLVVEASQMTVIQIAPDLLEVDAPGGGRAVVMVSGPQGLTSIVIRTTSAARADSATTPRKDAYAPDGHVFGSYQLYGREGGLVGPDMVHGAGWSQRTATHGFDGDVVLRSPIAGPTALQYVGLHADGPGWDTSLGDISVLLFPTMIGVNGSMLNLRGGRASFDLGETGVRVGALGGVSRALVCCRFFAPEDGVVGALTGGWSGGRTEIDALGGVIVRDGMVLPLGQVSGAFGAGPVDAGVMVAQSGPGFGSAMRVNVKAGPQVTVYANGAGSTAGFIRSIGASVPQVSGSAGVRYDDREKIALDFTSFVNHRVVDGQAQSQAVVRGHSVWRALPILSLSAGYQRSIIITPAPSGGDMLSAGVSLRPRNWWLSGNGLLSLRGDSQRQGIAAVETGWAPNRTVSVVAGYRYFTIGIGGAKVDRDQPWIGASLSSSSLHWRGNATLTLPRGATTATPDIRGSTSLGWRLRRFLELGLNGGVVAPLGSDQLFWSAGAFWEFRPTALPGSQGGLGLRGGVSGVVFLDRNKNGLRDEGEEGIGGLTLTLGDGRATVTDDDGRYAFRGLPTGTHALHLDRGARHALAATRRQVDVRPGARQSEDFPLTWGGRIQGVIYDDVHQNGVLDNGDPTVTTELVMLRDQRGVVIEQTYAQGGRFTFSGLAEGPYTIVVDPFGLPDGYRPVDDLDHDVFVEEGRAHSVHLRVQAIRAIGGIIYEDTDGDRQIGSKRDLGLGGVEVSLSTGQTTRTGPDGSYLFRDLPPGGYAVRSELSAEAKVVVLPTTPKEVLDLHFLLPRGTRAPAAARPRPSPRTGTVAVDLDAPLGVLPQGVALQVTATARLSNGERRAVTTQSTWSSSDDDTLDVSRQGVVTGRRAGRAGVTAEYDGVVASPLTFEVLGAPLEQVSVSPVGLRLNPGDTAELRVDVLDRSGRGGEVTAVAEWEVADTRVARIERGGTLRALRDGATTITARIGGAVSRPLEVQVMTARVTALSIEGMPARMPEGATVRLRATGFDTNLKVVDVGGEVTWSTSNPDVLQVSTTGVVTSAGRGTAQITCSIGSLFTRTSTVAVTNVPPLALEVLPPGMTLTLSDRQQFRARATFEDGTRGAVTGVVEWVVDGTAADVRQDGLVVPRETGTMTVRARYLGVESEPVTVTVTR